MASYKVARIALSRVRYERIGMRHFINLILLGMALCLLAFFYFGKKVNITQEVLDLFPQTADKEIIDIYQQFANSRHVLVAIRGFNQESRDTLHAFLDEIKTLPNVESVMTRTTSPQELEEFITDNYLYTAIPQPIDRVLTKEEINTRVLHGLENLRTQLLVEESLDSGLIVNADKVNCADTTHKEGAPKQDLIKQDSMNQDLKVQDSKEHNSHNQAANTKEQESVQDRKTERTQTAPKGSCNPDSLKHSPLNTIFHPHDPLSLLTLQVPKPYIFAAKDYGYMAIVTMKEVKNEVVQETLEGFERVVKKYPNIRYFSQNFMNIRNLDLILKEVNFLLGFATIACIILYFVIIRIPMLTINTICTLITANIIAILVVSSVYPKVTIMALGFGMGISNIAIDYMMHHNFFSLYVGRQRVFNRPVFYGYITTIIGFSACLFVPFPLLAQLSLYAIISLTLCYMSFAFIYPRIGFSEPRLFPRLANIRFQAISSYWFLAVSLCGFVFACMNIKFDFDLSKLDYQNKAMINERTFFTNAEGNTTQILLSSNSLDGVISLARKVEQTLTQNNAKTFIPLALLPTQEQMKNNEQFLQSRQVQENKAALLRQLPELKKEILHTLSKDSSLDEMGSKEDREEFIDDLLEMFKESYMLEDKPSFNVEKLEQMGLSVVVHTSTNQEDTNTLLSAMNLDMGQNESQTTSHSLGQDSQQEGVNLANLHADSQNLGKRFYYLVVAHNEDLPIIQSVGATLNGTQDSIEMRGLQHIMDNLANTIYMPMLIVFGIALCLMISMLTITARGAFLDSVVFILFPLASALCVIASHSELNIMHIFALLILVVVSIDYGIYSVKEGDNPRTAHAIFFSVITTGVSFGIMIISKTKALNSFGEVVFVGMLCILSMLVFHKPIRKTRKH